MQIRQRRHRTVRAILFVACTVLLSGCMATDTEDPSDLPVETVTVTVPKSDIKVGEKIQASAIAKDSNGDVLAGREISWTSTDASVATVASDGTVTGNKAGSVTISATVEGKKGSAGVTVSP